MTILYTVRCRYCHNSERKNDDWDATICKSCRKKKREQNAYNREVEKAARKFYRLVKQGKA